MLIITASIHAQEGPVLVAEHPQYEKFSLNNIQSSAELLYHYQHNENKTDLNTTTFTENRFQQLFNLSADGYIIHPNLVTMNLGGSFGLSQDTSTQEDNNSSSNNQSNAIVQNYNMSATLLRKEYMPITVFAQRSTAQVNTQFGATQEIISTNYGANVAINSLTIPSRMTYQHSTYEQNDPVGNNDFQTDQDTVTWHSEMSPAFNQHVYLDYSYSGLNQTSANLSQTTSQSHDFSLGHNLIFGSQNQFTLNSSMNYSQLQGNFEQTHLNYNETMQMRWSETLDTTLLYNFTRDQRTISDQDIHRINGKLVHKLYKSLTTTVNVGAITRDSNDGSTSLQKFGNVFVDYRKQIPYGTLNLGLSLSFDQDESTNQGSTTFISADTYTYTAPSSILVNHRNIVPGSIVVYNTTFFVYTEGLDYTLNYATDSVLMTIPLGSNITNGQTIYLDYSTKTDPSNTTTTIGEGLNIRYNMDEGWFKGLSLYVSFYKNHQTIDSSEPTSFTPDQTTDITYGADYHFWKMNLQARHHIHDSTISPYNTTNFTINYHDRISNRTAWDVSLAYDESNYTSQDELSTNWLFNSSISQQLGKNFYGTFTLGYQKGNTTSSGARDAFEQSFTLNWQYRQTSVYLSGRNAFINSSTQDSLSQLLEVGIKRTF